MHTCGGREQLHETTAKALLEASNYLVVVLLCFYFKSGYYSMQDRRERHTLFL